VGLQNCAVQAPLQEIVEPPPEATLSQEQAQVLALCEQGANVFFTGMGGTGKTYLLRLIVKRLTLLYGPGTVAAVAPTGVAAIICEGQTLHSFAGCGVPTYTFDFGKCWGGRDRGQHWRELRALVLDEVPARPAIIECRTTGAMASGGALLVRTCVRAREPALGGCVCRGGGLEVTRPRVDGYASIGSGGACAPALDCDGASAWLFHGPRARVLRGRCCQGGPSMMKIIVIIILIILILIILIILLIIILIILMNFIETITEMMIEMIGQTIVVVAAAAVQQ
jgi:hypothetical protein